MRVAHESNAGATDSTLFFLLLRVCKEQRQNSWKWPQAKTGQSYSSFFWKEKGGKRYPLTIIQPVKGWRVVGGGLDVCGHASPPQTTKQQQQQQHEHKEEELKKRNWCRREAKRTCGGTRWVILPLVSSYFSFIIVVVFSSRSMQSNPLSIPRNFPLPTAATNLFIFILLLLN